MSEHTVHVHCIVLCRIKASDPGTARVRGAELVRGVLYDGGFNREQVAIRSESFERGKK